MRILLLIFVTFVTIPSAVIAHHFPLIDAPFLAAVKEFAKIYDSNCATILYTPQNYRRDFNRLMRHVHSLASDFGVDVSVQTTTFKQYQEGYNNQVFVQCISPMNIIMHCDQSTLRELAEVTETVDLREEVIWIVYINDSAYLYDYFEQVNIRFNTIMIAFHVISNDRIEFHETYRVSKERPLRINRLGEWERNKGCDILRGNIYTRRNNLEGITLRTGSTQNAPIHSFEKNNEGEMELVGYFPEVWKELEKMINFTSVHYLSIDQVTGISEGNGSWNGLIGMLQRDEIDVAVSEFIMDTQRSKVVSFSKPLLKTSYQLFFKSVGPNYNWDAILRPFYWTVWVVLIAWITVSSISLTICYKLSYAHNLENNGRNEFNWINSLFFLMKSVCAQGHNILPVSIPCRIIFLMAYLSTAILHPSYSASLISYLTSREPIRPFDSLKELLEDGRYRLQTNAKTAEYTYFSEASDPMLRHIFNTILIKSGNLPLNTKEGLDRVCKDQRLAHFGDMAVAHSYLQSIRIEKNCEIVTLSQSISTIFSSMALVRRSPYKSVLNHHLQEMEDYGIISRARKISLPTDKIEELVTIEVSLADVAAVFILLALGWGISSLILLTEIIRDKRQQRKLIFKKNDYLSKNQWKFSY